MKTLFVAAALALTTFSASANNTAAEKKVNVSVSKAFQLQFGNVSEVNWAPASKSMLRATFTQDGETVNAFFNPAGDFVGSTIDRKPGDVPFKLRKAIANKDKDAIITEAVEFQDNDSDAWFVKVYSNGSEKLYKGTSLGLIEEVHF